MQRWMKLSLFFWTLAAVALAATPARVWSTYLGGAELEGLPRGVYDPDGNLVLACSSTSPTLNLPNGLNTRNTSGSDLLVLKISPANKVLWWTFNNGIGVWGLAVDSLGNIYAAGKSGAGGGVVSFDSAGKVRFSRADDGWAIIWSVAAIPGGGAVIGGVTRALASAVDGVQTQYGGDQSDGFVATFDAKGAITHSTYLGGSTIDSVTGVATDPTGNIWVTGQGFSPDFPGPGGTHIAIVHSYVVRLSKDLKQIHFVTQFNANPGGPLGIAAGPTGAWVAGDTGNAFVTTPDAWQRSKAPNRITGFLLHVDQSGALVYATYAGGSNGDELLNIRLDSAGNVYAGGFSESTDFPFTADAASKDPLKGNGTFVIVSPAGKPIYSSLVVGIDTSGFAVNPAGEVALVSRTTLGNLPVGPSPIQATLPGKGNLWVARYVTGLLTPPKPVIAPAGIFGLPGSTPPIEQASPGAALSINGVNLSSKTVTIAAADLVSQAAPTALAGTCVEIGGVRAPLLSVSAAKIRVITPIKAGLADAAAVRVLADCDLPTQAASGAATIPITAFTPEVYLAPAPDGTPLAMAMDADSGVVVNTADAGILPGTNIRLFLNGLGDVGVAAGSIQPSPVPLVADLQIQIGDQVVDPSTVIYAGLSNWNSDADSIGLTPFNIGVFEIRLALPADLPVGDLPLMIMAGGVATMPGPVLRIEAASVSQAQAKHAK